MSLNPRSTAFLQVRSSGLPCMKSFEIHYQLDRHGTLGLSPNLGPLNQQKAVEKCRSDWLTTHHFYFSLVDRQSCCLPCSVKTSGLLNGFLSASFLYQMKRPIVFAALASLMPSSLPWPTRRPRQVEADSHSKFFFSIYRFLDEPSACLDTHGGRRVFKNQNQLLLLLMLPGAHP